MKKILLVTAVLLMSCLAFAAPPTTYNLAFDGFCDGMSLTLGNGAQMSNVAGPRIFVAGTHTGCFITNDSGFKHGISKLIPPFVSPVLDVADGEGVYISVQYLVRPTAGFPCVWANYYNIDGLHNNHFLTGTCTVGAAPSGATGRSTNPVGAK
jgi:hypothetical protein